MYLHTVTYILLVYVYLRNFREVNVIAIKINHFDHIWATHVIKTAFKVLMQFFPYF